MTRAARFIHVRVVGKDGEPGADVRFPDRLKHLAFIGGHLAFLSDFAKRPVPLNRGVLHQFIGQDIHTLARDLRRKQPLCV